MHYDTMTHAGGQMSTALVFRRKKQHTAPLQQRPKKFQPLQLHRKGLKHGSQHTAVLAIKQAVQSHHRQRKAQQQSSSVAATLLLTGLQQEQQQQHQVAAASPAAGADKAAAAAAATAPDETATAEDSTAVLPGAFQDCRTHASAGLLLSFQQHKLHLTPDMHHAWGSVQGPAAEPSDNSSLAVQYRQLQRQASITSVNQAAMQAALSAVAASAAAPAAAAQKAQAASVRIALDVVKPLLALAARRVSPALAQQLKHQLMTALQAAAAAAAHADSSRPFSAAEALQQMIPGLQAAVEKAVRETAECRAAAVAAAATLAQQYRQEVAEKAAAAAAHSMAAAVVGVYAGPCYGSPRCATSTGQHGSMVNVNAAHAWQGMIQSLQRCGSNMDSNCTASSTI